MTLKLLYDNIDPVKGPLPNLKELFLYVNSKKESSLFKRSIFAYLNDYTKIESSFLGAEKSDWIYPLEVSIPIYHIDNLICGGKIKKTHFWNFLSPKVKQGVLENRGKIVFNFQEPIGRIFSEALIREIENSKEYKKNDEHIPFYNFYFASHIEIDHPNFLDTVGGNIYFDDGYIWDLKTKRSNLSKTKKFICFLHNYDKTYYRYLLLDFLEKTNLLKQGLVSAKNKAIDFYTEYEKAQVYKLNHRPTFDSSDDIYHTLEIEQIQDTYLTLVAESEWMYSQESTPYDCFDYPYTTEKTLRNFFYKKIFIVIGQPYSLKYLHKRGFKTFHPFIDESYDSVENPMERMVLALSELRKFCNKSEDEILKLYKDIDEVLEFNYNHYMNLISKDRLYKILKELNGAQ